MNNYNILLEKIEKKQAKIGIIGLGYVGLPLSLLFAQNGFLVTGFVRSEKQIKPLEIKTKNQLKIEVFKKPVLEKQDVLIICVQTPVTENKIPDLTDLENVVKELSQIKIFGKLIINESTVAPFTTSHLLGNLGKEYFLASSPERIDPGNKTKTTQNIPKVIGAKDRESLSLASRLYQQILTGGIVEVGSLEAAEMVKMLENTYRAVNIALINEFAKLAEVLGLDILEVIEAAKTKWSFQAHYPGIGVGGHCIPVDPYYILALAKSKNLSMSVVKEGLLENENMPKFFFDKVTKHYKKGSKVLVYGLTYKRDVSDLRESPVKIFCDILKKRGISFVIYDPILSKKDIESLGFSVGKLTKSDVFIVGTDHSQLREDYKKAVGDKTIVIDGRNFFKTKVGKGVYGVGRKLL